MFTYFYFTLTNTNKNDSNKQPVVYYHTHTHTLAYTQGKKNAVIVEPCFCFGVNFFNTRFSGKCSLQKQISDADDDDVIDLFKLITVTFYGLFLDNLNLI